MCRFFYGVICLDKLIYLSPYQIKTPYEISY